MKDKFLNLALFLLKEFEKEEDKIKAEFLKEGIDLEVEKQKVLEQIKKYKARLKRERAQDFKNSFVKYIKSRINFTNEIELEDTSEFAIQYRRNHKKSGYKLTTDDYKKLKFISDFKRKNLNEESKEKIDFTERNS